MRDPATPFAESQILSELHTHFPALLYDADRFRSVAELLNYVQARLRQRYDVYTNARNAYRNQIFNFDYQNRNTIGSADNILSYILPLLRESGNDASGNTVVPTPSGTRTPTLEQLRSASRVFAYNAEAGDRCAVCQDAIQAGNIVRQITGCTHTFHIDCLDTWFQRNSSCPNCRFNIITSARAPSTTGPSAP